MSKKPHAPVSLPAGIPPIQVEIQVDIPMRERRKAERLRRKVLRWWNEIPVAKRLPYYVGDAIASAAGEAITTLGPALRELGWHSEQVRLAGGRVSVWVPPESNFVKRSVGRPSHKVF
ncbi:hypothetical protein [Caldimonas tepidiphila]|uniref:hypothetical protein n=1 Tax=Caldimonas tepidiphila TaxID=2315841 RepID=UPI001300AF23|nr:hypothetical protein [Caldimonas tepidiphila]